MEKLPVIYNSKEIPIWIKYWFSKKSSRKISEIITGQSNYILENTLYKRFKKFEDGGDTEQTQYDGRNLCNDSKIQGSSLKLYFDVKKATKNIAVSFTTNETLAGNSVYLDIDGISKGIVAYITASANTKATLLITFQDDMYELFSEANEADISIYKSGSSFNIPTDAQIENGSVVTDFQPFVGGIPSPNEQYSQPIHNVVGTIVNKVSNKNSFDDNNITFADGILNDYGEPTASSSSHYTENFFSVLPNTIYTLSGTLAYGAVCKVYFYDKNKNWISRALGTEEDVYTFTTPNNCYYIRIQVGKKITLQTGDVQLEIGEIVTSYVEHAEQNYPFTLEEGQKLYIGDTLEDDGIHHKRTQIVLDGTENWQVESETAYIELTNAKGKNNINTLCNYFIYTSVTNNTYGYIKFGGTNKNLLFYKAITEKGSLDNWKTFLAQLYANGTPVIVEYELAEEQIVPYNSTQQAQYNAIKNAKTYKGTTIVYATSDELAPILTIQYWEKNTNETNLNLTKVYKNKEEIPNKIEIEETETKTIENGTEVEETETKTIENGTEIEESEVKENETDS